MFFQIHEIILWPRRPDRAPRRLKFELGQVNVISGASRTGKSAIIPILDYCLGSEKCSIPVKTIRDACSWFGILVETTEGQKLFARREPGAQKSTDDMFVAEGKNVQVPDRIPDRSTNVNKVKRDLDLLAGLTSLQFDPDSDSGHKSRPSFRDLTSFMFQPQNIIANPNVLYYKADSVDHREKLKTIFPYVLGAITPELLATRYEYSRLVRDLRRKEQELKNVQQVTQQWTAEIQARVAQARELGLIKPSVDGEDKPFSPGTGIAMLRSVVRGAETEVRVTTETVSQAVSELGKLQEEEGTIPQSLSRLRRRSVEMSQLRSTAERYRQALEVQQDRLEISTWLRQLYDKHHSCPVCGNAMNEVDDHLGELVSHLRELEASTSQLANTPTAFDREMERVRSEIALTTEKLRGVQTRRTALQRLSEDARGRHYSVLQISRFVGNLESELKVYERVGQRGDLREEVDSLRERVAALARQVSEDEIRERTRRALQIVDANAARILPDLDTERPNDPVELSIPELTLKVKGVDREDFLWEIGSGSNWLSYHIAVSLGLHQFFGERARFTCSGAVGIRSAEPGLFPETAA